jgi:hypothetical protein
VGQSWTLCALNASFFRFFFGFLFLSLFFYFCSSSFRHTSVIVNVSPEHVDETLCTMRFGKTVACVSNKSTVVRGSNANEEIAKIKKEVARLARKKKQLVEEGHAGGFVAGCVNTEKQSLTSNMDKLAQCQLQLGALKKTMMEVVGHTVGGGKGKRHALSLRIESAEKEEYNVRMLVLRQQSIRTLWRAATPMYNSVVAELKEKENELRMIV